MSGIIALSCFVVALLNTHILAHYVAELSAVVLSHIVLRVMKSTFISSKINDGLKPTSCIPQILCLSIRRGLHDCHFVRCA